MKPTKFFFIFVLLILTIVSCNDDNIDLFEAVKWAETGSTESPVFSENGASKEISFTVAKAWTASVVNTRADSWLIVSPTQGKAGDAKLNVRVENNDTYDERSANIILKAGEETITINVTQKQRDALTLTSTTFEVENTGGEINIEVKANVDYTFYLDKDCEAWIEAIKTRALSTNNLVFNVKPNYELERRQGRIIIKSGELQETAIVYQACGVPSILLTQSEVTVDATAQDLKVDVQANVDVEVEVEDCNWIKENLTRALSTNSYYFSVAENSTLEPRQAKIKFINKDNALSETLIVTQKGKDVRDRETEIMHELYQALNLNITDFLFFGYGRYNWSLDIPIEQWDCIEFDNEGRITSIRCPEYNSNTDSRIKYHGYIPESISELSHLKHFIISDSSLGLIRPIPNSIGNLKQLETFIVHVCNIPGDIPEEICLLENLKTLNIVSYLTKQDDTGNKIDYDFNYRGNLPLYIGNLKNLQELSISWSFNGSLPESIGQLENLEVLRLTDNTTDIPDYDSNGEYIKSGFEQQPIGTIPESILGMKRLRELEIICGFSGDFPKGIANLTNLERLQICSHYLSGELPSNLGNMTNLERLDLYYCNLGGPLPESLGNCKKLRGITIEGCNFTSFPASLATFLDERDHCSSLNEHDMEMRIYGNRMTGKLPSEILNHKNFYLFATNFLRAQQPGYGFDWEGFKYPACKDSYTDCFTGKTINLPEIYSSNKYTLVFRYNHGQWEVGGEGQTKRLAAAINQLSEKYAEKGLGVICGLVDVDEPSAIKSYTEELKLDKFQHLSDHMGKTLKVNDGIVHFVDNTAFFNDYINCWRSVPTMGIIDQDGNYVYLFGGMEMWDYDAQVKEKMIFSSEEEFIKAVEALFQ